MLSETKGCPYTDTKKFVSLLNYAFLAVLFLLFTGWQQKMRNLAYKLLQ